MGFFADDTLRLSDRLTLNLGIRYDHNLARIPELQVLNDDGVATGERVAGRTLYTWNVVSPRAGFNLELSRDGKTILSGHYGRYYRGINVGEYWNSIGVTPHVPEPGLTIWKGASS